MSNSYHQNTDISNGIYLIDTMNTLLCSLITCW